MDDETNRVHFLSAYVAQQRAEIAGDKASLGQFFLAKAALAGALVTAAAIENQSVVMLVGALLPFALMLLDFLYRKRLNEVFRRWRNLHEDVLPEVREAAKLGDMRLFEDVVTGGEAEIMQEERLIKTLVLCPSLLFSVIATRLALDEAGGMDERLIGGASFALYPAIIVVFYVLLFEAQENFRRTYVTAAVVISGLVGIGAGILVQEVFLRGS